MQAPLHISKIKILATLASIGLGLILLVLVGSIEVKATQFCDTKIDDGLTVTPDPITFGTVFPEEVLLKKLLVSLSSSFLNSSRANDVEYRIVQKIKPRQPEDATYCQSHPTDFSRCYPTLCPYLSKEPDLSPANDVGVPAFHDPANASSTAYGRMAKSDQDTQDLWTIDLHVPCFQGQCAEDNIVPKAYEVDPTLEGSTFGCDLYVQVDRQSFLDLTGSVRVCKVALSASGQMGNGAGNPGVTFTLPGITPNPQTSQGAPAGQIPNSIFVTPLSLNTALFGAHASNAQCVTYSNLALGGYYYGEETISSPDWRAPKYNDESPASAGAVYLYDGRLFDGNPINDALREKHADGFIRLTEEKPNQTVVVVNQPAGEREGIIGFWKNWNNHNTYTESQINGWLANINASSGWLISEAGYSANTSGMAQLINDSTGCSGALRACAKKKFLAQYLALRLNVESGRKALGNTYSLNAAIRTYLGIGNPATLANIIAAIEGKLPDNGTTPTRNDFILMMSGSDFINNQGV